MGLKIENGFVSIKPCIPKDWKEYQIQYKWGLSVYNIVIKNPNLKNVFDDDSKVFLNGNLVENKIKLDGSTNVYNIEVIL